MSQDRIMYVCAECAQNSPEGCGHFDRKNLRIAPSGEWACQDCYESASTIDRAPWHDLPIPPEYRPVSLQDRGGK